MKEKAGTEIPGDGGRWGGGGGGEAGGGGGLYLTLHRYHQNDPCMTKHNTRIFGVSPFFKLQNNT